MSIQGFGETIMNIDGEAKFMSVPYGSYDFTAHPNVYTYPDLQEQTGQVTVNQLTQELTVTLQPQSSVSDRGIFGVITDASTGLPLRRGILYINAQNGAEQQRTPSVRSDGSFSITGLGNGEYRVHVESDGYDAQNVVVTPVAGGLELNIALTPNRDYLTGYITDRNGFPVRGALVEFIDPVTTDVVEDRYSNSDGSYHSYFENGSMYNPPNGVYLVRVTPPAGSDLGVTYYPSASSPADAVPVDMSAGSLVRHADITMLGTPLAAVNDFYSTPVDTMISADYPDYGLLANDDGYGKLRLVALQGEPTVANTSITATTNEGGEVGTNSFDGMFYYTPPAGFTGSTPLPTRWRMRAAASPLRRPCASPSAMLRSNSTLSTTPTRPQARHCSRWTSRRDYSPTTLATPTFLSMRSRAPQPRAMSSTSQPTPAEPC